MMKFDGMILVAGNEKLAIINNNIIYDAFGRKLGRVSRGGILDKNDRLLARIDHDRIVDPNNRNQLGSLSTAKKDIDTTILDLKLAALWLLVVKRKVNVWESEDEDLVEIVTKLLDEETIGEK